MEDTQLGMDIEKPKFEKLYSFKRRVEMEEEAFISTPLKNTATFWITFFISLFSFASIFFQVFTKWNVLPENIPLLFSQIDSKWIILPKMLILGYGAIPVFIFILLLTLFRKLYDLEKPLTITLLILLNIVNIFTLIGITEILSLTTQ